MATLTERNIDGYTIISGINWVSGPCRRGLPHECPVVVQVRDKWMLCSRHEVHDIPQAVRTAQAAIQTPGSREGRSCRCECGGTTKGGLFLPGHDARLRSQLLQAVAQGDDDARMQVIELGWSRFLPTDTADDGSTPDQ